MEPDAKTLVLIVGPTGVGKSAAGLALARRVGGEIVNADSMQVYRGFDIGTDKPPAEDRRAVVHHLIDIADPSSQFTAADFAALAFEAATDILGRGGVPIVLGGTGLYVKALLDGLFPGPGRDDGVRRELEREARERGLETLWRRLETADPAYAKKITPRDKVRIVRALEVQAVTGTPLSAHFARTRSRMGDFRVVKVGLDLERKELYRNIEVRVDRMFERGLVDEVKTLLASGVAESAPPFKALGYKHVLRYLKGESDFEETVARMKIDTRHFAKRQMTWFHKMAGIRWFSPAESDTILEFVERNMKKQGPDL